MQVTSGNRNGAWKAVEYVATDVIGAAIEVHKHLGPGFIERIYHEALCFELSSRRIAFDHEYPVLLNYKRMAITGQRIDLTGARCVVVELKAATRIDLAHEARVISYLRKTSRRSNVAFSIKRARQSPRFQTASCSAPI